MMNAKLSFLWIVSLVAIGCGLEKGSSKNQCAVQADCLDGFVCNGAGICEVMDAPDAPGCVPATCDANQCGMLGDGCGGTIDCSCTLPAICEGAGIPNRCAAPPQCVPETDATLCAQAALTECGTTSVVDQCGITRNPDCGTCTTGVCGAQSYGLCDEIVCSSSGWCRAVDGTLAGTLPVRDLWGTGTEVFTAAADNSNGKVLRFDGTSWKSVAAGAHALRGGAGTGASLWFASANGALLKPSGSSLVVSRQSSRTWTSMHAISSTDVWVVGQFGSGSGASARASHWDGGAWTDVNFGGPFDLGWHLLAVSAASSSSVWAVGAAVGNGSVTDLPAGPLVASYNGNSWTINRTFPTQNYLRAVHAIAANDVWAVGDAGTILHYNGTDWTVSPSGVTQQLLAVTGSGSTLWAAGAGGTILKKVGAGAWTTEVSGTTRAINALWATSTGDVWAGGDLGLLLRYHP